MVFIWPFHIYLELPLALYGSPKEIIKNPWFKPMSLN